MNVFASLKQDLAYAIRSLSKSPGLAIGVILTLALGLGVNMAMFSFLDVVFLRPPAGVERPSEIRRVWRETQFRSGAQYWPGFAYPSYDAMRSALGDRVATTLYTSPVTMRIGQPDAESLARTSYVESTFFPLLGVRAFAGRLISADDDRLGNGQQVAVASHAYWRSQLGADLSAIDREIVVRGQWFTLIGVAAEGFTGVELDAADLFLPLASQPSGRMPWWQNTNQNGFQMLLRPARGEPIAETALVERIATALERPEIGRFDRDSVVRAALGSVIRAQGPGTQEQEVKIATRLAGVTAVVLLIACANAVNLLLARAVRRRREIAVRLALGMSRARLARLLLSESVLLSLGAAVAAVLAAYWGGELLRALLLPDIQWADDASPMHWRVILLALITGIGAGMVAGMLPAFQSAKTELTVALKSGNGSSQGHSRTSVLRTGLVIAQAALSVVLLVGSGLFVSSLDNIRNLRVGFEVPQVMFGEVRYDTRDSARDARLPQKMRELAVRLRGRTGVDAVALSRMAPTQGFSYTEWLPDVDTARFKRPFAVHNVVSAEYFDATGMRVIRGEALPRGLWGASPPVVVVNEHLAKTQWPNMEVIGRCMYFPPERTCYRVVGVAETALFDELIEKPTAQYYVPADRPPANAGTWISTLVVRAQPDARDAVSAELRRAIREAFPGGRPAINTLESFLEPRYRPWRLGAVLFTTFGALALIIAAVGIYSTVSYAVAQRTQEFGVRAALGAQARDILDQVLRESTRTVAIGVAVGAALALASGRFVASLLYGIEPSDPGVIMTVAFGLLLVAIVAALGPGWRAARVDPIIALRSE